jgi:2-deoxy-D-gluconate 3-dehydrogenase
LCPGGAVGYASGMTMKIGDLFGIEGKQAVVTGGSRGIGEMIAAGFLTNGAKVFISSRKANVCDETAARLADTYGGTCISIPADLSKLEGIEAFGRQLREHTDELHILVNNAGASWGAPLGEFPEVGWDKVMDTNVKGPFFLTQDLLPLLEKAATPDDPSRVINVGSIDGLGTPAFETFSYGPSKAAIHHLTRVLAGHLTRRNIIVNAIAPGPFPTWML